MCLKTLVTYGDYFECKVCKPSRCHKSRTHASTSKECSRPKALRSLSDRHGIFEGSVQSATNPSNALNLIAHTP